MNIINLLRILLLFFTIQSCIPTKRITFKNSSIQNFENWKEDSIKNFLSDKWIRIGSFDGNEFVEDTLRTFTTNKDNLERTEIVNQNGLFHLINGKLEKQDNIPSVLIDFDNRLFNIDKGICYLPNFSKCSTGCFGCPSDKLIFKKGKMIREIYHWSLRRIINPIHYIDENIILIEDAAYVRHNKWEEYAANNAYNTAVK